MLKEIVDVMKRNKPDNWVILRHYTKRETVELILAELLMDLSGFSLYRLYGSAGGECPVSVGGPYLTNDVFIDPQSEENRIKISETLGIKNPPPGNDPDEVTAYIDLRINSTDYPNYLNDFNVCNIRGGTQLHHKGTLYFGAPNSYQQYKLVP